MDQDKPYPTQHELRPHEQREIDAKREDHRQKQPYASELDDRDVEHAQNSDAPSNDRATPHP